MAQVSIEHLKRLKTGVILYYVPAGEGTQYNGASNMYALDTSEQENDKPDWKVIAQTSEFTPGEETEETDITFMSATQHVKRKEKETTITADTFEAKVIDWSPYMHALKLRTKDPLQAGVFVKTHQKSDPYATVWLKIEHWSATGDLIYTEYKYAKIRISTSDPENMTLVQPTIIGEELEAEYTGAVYTEASGIPKAENA